MEKTMNGFRFAGFAFAVGLFAWAGSGLAAEPVLDNDEAALGAAVSVAELQGERGKSGLAVAITEQKNKQKNTNILIAPNSLLKAGDVTLAEGAISNNQMSIGVINTGANTNFAINNSMNVTVYQLGN